MKTLTFLLLFIPCLCTAQIAFTPFLSGAVSKEFRWTLGAELQASNVAVIGGWTPLKVKGIQSDGFTFAGVVYLYAFRTSPYFEIGLLTNGKVNPSDVTGMAVRSGIIMVGLRVFPIELNDNFLDRLNFSFAIGVDLKEDTKVYLRGELKAKFTLFKWE